MSHSPMSLPALGNVSGLGTWRAAGGVLHGRGRRRARGNIAWGVAGLWSIMTMSSVLEVATGEPIARVLSMVASETAREFLARLSAGWSEAGAISIKSAMSLTGALIELFRSAPKRRRPMLDELLSPAGSCGTGGASFSALPLSPIPNIAGRLRWLLMLCLRPPFSGSLSLGFCFAMLKSSPPRLGCKMCCLIQMHWILHNARAVADIAFCDNTDFVHNFG
ncbi:hypothetical protein BX661DRAFT_212658 [Kickxella alabastrina]|uniref:uncharacterized protein n=1 Tax=Kickxella alabastrina TaxID=61397 RepID=UPI002220AE7F|nr:uncharacterized protein BX661DRAFT_212658 [Kickxella alabastrina]KAI7827316.1 hypothetical protein BX661DRAFT_212658 [Kickxella alabastrina]